MADHEWAGDSAFREVLDGLMGGVGMARFPLGLDTPIGPLSGGERRRIALAGALLHAPELLLLDEPTNHLDVEAVDWLARHLAARRGSLLVVTHDRWFLDAVCTATWEVADGGVLRYEGGYAAYVLARAERERREAVQQERRQNLLRKELAWLRRGPPARTSKPRFRIDAANALIADEPEPRDRAELLRFASARLGDRVLDAVDVSVAYDGRPVLRDVTWRLGPGDRVALVGANGSGKTSLVRLLSGELEPAGRRGRARRDRPARPSLAGHRRDPRATCACSSRWRRSRGDGHARRRARDHRGAAAATASGSAARRRARRSATSRAASAAACSSCGCSWRARTCCCSTSRPTTSTPTRLTALEDLLDSWAGTLVVVSHDRYFVERACDDVFAITGDGGLRHLPGGIDAVPGAAGGGAAGPAAVAAEPKAPPAGAVVRATRKEVARLERALERLGAREAALHAAMAESATDFARLGELQARALGGRRGARGGGGGLAGGLLGPGGLALRGWLGGERPAWQGRSTLTAHTVVTSTIPTRPLAPYPAAVDVRQRPKRREARPRAGQRLERLADLGDPGAHLGVADLDGQHRVLQLGELLVGALRSRRSRPRSARRGCAVAWARRAARRCAPSRPWRSAKPAWVRLRAAVACPGPAGTAPPRAGPPVPLVERLVGGAERSSAGAIASGRSPGATSSSSSCRASRGDVRHAQHQR